MPENPQSTNTGTEYDPNYAKITIIMPSNAYFTAGIRQFTSDLVTNMGGFSEQWAFRFQSVIDELCNNAIAHGSKPGTDIRLTFIVKRNEYLDISVEDTGTGKKRKSPADLTKFVRETALQSPDTLLQMRERGLRQIVNSWTDVLEFSPSALGGIKVHVIKYIKPDAPQTVHLSNS